MRLVAISDTHGLHNRIESLPPGEILVHAGDFMNAGFDLNEIVSFNRWLGEQPFKYRLVCAGNHDRYFQNAPQVARALLTNAIYLENTGNDPAQGKLGRAAQVGGLPPAQQLFAAHQAQLFLALIEESILPQLAHEAEGAHD